jgi:hypothetical protein
MASKIVRLLALGCVLLVVSRSAAGELQEISAETLRDKIRGGLLGQVLGNLNGLPHEMKYIDEPGNLATYTPALPEGARTDDDTDFEWVYIVEMQRRGEPMLPPAEIADRLIDLAEQVIVQNGGARRLVGGRPVFDLPTEPARPLISVTALEDRARVLGSKQSRAIETDLTEGSTETDRARAVYMATCLEQAEALKAKHPEDWQRGVTALEAQWRVLQVLFHHSPVPGAERIQGQFIRAGIAVPAERRDLWE